ncbi:MAG: PIN domain-containing protein [Bacteroidota bacterium]
MGKNDLWIAATASHYDLKLLTTDKDFLHLEDKFIDLAFINLEEIKTSIKGK